MSQTQTVPHTTSNPGLKRRLLDTLRTIPCQDKSDEWLARKLGAKEELSEKQATWR